MSSEVELPCVLALVAFGSYGWGTALLALLDRRAAPDRSSLCEEATPALTVCVGIALLLAVGGIAVAADVAYFALLIGWLLVGTAFGLARVAPRLGALLRSRATLPALLFVIVALLLVAIAYGAAIGGPTNPNDDYSAYLYLAERLLRTGGMLDSFNFRRITSYGGEELFQALVLRVAGYSAGLVVEWCLFALLSVALLIGRARRPWALPMLVAIGLVVVVARPIGAAVNVAPTFSGVALTLALLQLLAVPVERHDLRRYALAGLFVAALMSLRYAFAIPAAVAVLTSAFGLLGTRRAAGRLAVATLTGVGAISGWAIALQNSSGTPMWPIIAGDYNGATRWRDPRIHTIAQYFDRIRGEVVTDGWGLELLAAIVLVVLVQMAARRSPGFDALRPSAVVLFGAAAGCATLLGIATVELSGGTYAEIGRYNAPSALAVVLASVGLVWRDAEARRARRMALQPPSTGARNARSLLQGYAAAIVASLAMLALVTPAASAATTANPVLRLGRAAGSDVRGALGSDDDRDPLVQDQAARYEAINKKIPAGSRVLAAVDLPMLLDFSRFSFATLDIVGIASPSPHLPLEKGASAVVTYLQRLGYDGIVASDTEGVGLYSYAGALSSERSGVWDDEVMAQGTIAWSRILTQLSHDRALTTSRVPTLVYFGFPKH